MNNKELNEKLARWIGSEMEYDIVYDKPFTESLDDCFKYLVLKLREKGYRAIVFSYINFDAEYGAIIENCKGICENSLGKAPALALCKAIEKLIDNEK